jgi:hypothetical protein
MKTIPLSKGMNAIVDDEDFDILSNFRWQAHKHHSGAFYATRSSSRAGGKCKRFIQMHRVIAGAPDGLHVDHINGNPLDNRRSNLRFATNSENIRNANIPCTNTSGFKGVVFEPSRRSYRAIITVDGRKKHLGRFKTAREAGAAYDAAARSFFGDFARTNSSLNRAEAA